MNNESMNVSTYESEYIPSVIRFGRITNLLGVLFAFLPALVLTFVFDLHPPVSAIFTGFIMQASVSGVFWFVEPISYSPVLGVAGIMFALLKTGCLAFLPGTPSYAVVIVSVFGTILIGRKIVSAELAKKKE